jgi:hypothetical protein
MIDESRQEKDSPQLCFIELRPGRCKAFCSCGDNAYTATSCMGCAAVDDFRLRAGQSARISNVKAVVESFVAA